MRVLVVHCVYKYKGGEDTVVYQEIALLKSKGVEVELLEFSNEGNSILKILQLPFNIAAYSKARKQIKLINPDIVHVHNLHFGASPSVVYAIKSLGVPFVMTLHNYRLLCPSAMLFHNGELFLDSLKQKFPWTAIKNGVYHNSRLLTLWISLSMKLHTWLGTWSFCNQYIVLSEYAKKLFHSGGIGTKTNQIIVKANFSDIPQFISTASDEYFLYVGRLSEEKGVRVLLDAFVGSPFKLKIAGDGPLMEDVQSISRKCSQIEFLGSVKKDKLIPLLRNCSALIFPSIWYEGMPLTIIEAFACGVPVIASKIGAMENMIQDNYNGFHFLVGNSKDLLQKIEAWHKMPKEKKEEMKTNALTTYTIHYTPEQNASQLLSIYNSLIKKESSIDQLATNFNIVRTKAYN